MGNEEIVGKEHACCSGKRRTERKGHNLVAGVSMPIVSAAISFSRMARQALP